MANCNPPVKNQAFDLGFTLYKSDGSVIANPGTLTAKISKDFGDYADIGTTSEEDTTYGQMKAALSATEMNADVVSIYIKDDTSGCVPFTATIYTCSATRGLAGTALPDAAADAAGGLPISDAGGLDIDAIKAKTDNLPASPAAVGSAMTLADDAITAAKFDESTAFPLKSADTGATAVARTGADSDTLETLSDEIAALPTAHENADALLGRNIAGGSSVGRTVTQALRALRNKIAIAAGTMTVYEEDDTTPDWTGAVTTDPAAEPITEIDPA